LGTDYIDLYQIHWPDSTTPIDETFEAVGRLIQQGKVRYAGVCNYSATQVKEAGNTCDIVSDQVHYSMLTRGIEKELVPYCLDNEKAILAYSPMERGLLTGKITPGHQFAAGDDRINSKLYQPDKIKMVNDFLKKIKPIADEQGATLSQLVLRWTIEQPGITIALAGARNAEQSVSNAKAIDVRLTEEQLAYIDSEIDVLNF
jgi:Predicted oxidoreductases (related to aryl-alcohol dehydrogenases)